MKNSINSDPDYIPLSTDKDRESEQTKKTILGENNSSDGYIGDIHESGELIKPQLIENEDEKKEDQKSGLILPLLTKRLSTATWIVIISFLMLSILLLIKNSVIRYSQFANMGGTELGIFYLFCVLIFFGSVAYLIIKAIRDYIHVDDGSELALISSNFSKKSDPAEVLEYAQRIIAQYEQHPLESVQTSTHNLQERIRNTVESEDLLGEIQEGILKHLDREAEKIISRTAKETFIGTAISPIPAVDIGIVAWRSIFMVRDIATLYGYRPGFLGSLRLLSRVLSTIAFAGISDIIADATANFIGNTLLNRLAANLAHAFGTSLLVIRLGISACINCRPYPLRKNELRGYVTLLFKGMKSILLTRVYDEESA